jgi:Fic family protein
VIRYEAPRRWIDYRALEIAALLADAKAAVLALRTMPYQREWVEALQRVELKMEVAGTSRIEGADFTERELDAALEDQPGQLLTRSQRQAHAALRTYKWIALLPDDRPLTGQLVLEIHRHIVTGADDDHCPPGELRHVDENVLFGSPRHRGCEGGEACQTALEGLAAAIRTEFRDHDPLIQAFAAHYHLAAMHPFLDGNGRTARALEALLLQRAGLRDTCFVAMSNYYYDEKSAYLASLAKVRADQHDLTAFLAFGLRGLKIQVQRLLSSIQREMKKALFRNVMFDLFSRLQTPRKRVIAERQLALLKLLLAEEKPLSLAGLERRVRQHYASLRNPEKALARDLNHLSHLQAIDGSKNPAGDIDIWVNLEWPTEITEKAFFQRLKSLPKAKTHSFLQ